MFKLESYVTPLLLSYVDKYVKNIRPEDSQLSLWGGDAVFNNLDLKLDVLEQELNLPFSFINGHIHELRIHVPWTKLISEPVVITINTIECVLKLKGSAESDSSSTRTSSSTGLSKRRLRQQQSLEAPPSYIQGLVKRILNNISIVCNNVILKYVEDDIVLSLNIKSVDFSSVNEKWDQAFVDVSPQDPALRKVLSMEDVTVCLDKRDASGKIEAYQDPLLYRCFLLCRIYFLYDNPHSKVPAVMRLHVSCEQLDFSITDQQLPMFLRLLELCLALYYGEITNEVSKAPVTTEGGNGDGDHGWTSQEYSQDEEQMEGWGSWAWSFVPQILPAWEQEEGEEGNESFDGTPVSPTIQQFGCYIQKMTCVFKVTSGDGDPSRFSSSSSRLAFQPLVVLQQFGTAMEATVKGLEFVNFQLGVIGASVSGLNECACGFEDLQDDGARKCKEIILFRSGVAPSGGHTYNYLTSSLFDPLCPENCGQQRQYIFDWDAHLEYLTETAMVERFPALSFDYLYELSLPEDWYDYASEITSTYLEDSNWKERALCRLVVGPCRLDISSSLVHRLEKILESAVDHEYPPYSTAVPEAAVFPQPYPTEDQLDSVTNFIPFRTVHLTVLKPTIRISSALHSKTDAVQHRSRRKKKRRLSGITQPFNLMSSPMPVIVIGANCLDISLTRSMYGRKVAAIVSVLNNPPEALSYYCFSHLSVKLYSFQINLTTTSATSPPNILLLEPCSVAFFQKQIQYPQYFVYKPEIQRMEILCEIAALNFSFTKFQMMAVTGMLMSWIHGSHVSSLFSSSSLISNLIAEGDSRINFIISGVDWCHSQNAVLVADSFVIASFSVFLQDRKHTLCLVNAAEATSEIAHIVKTESSSSDWTYTQQSPWARFTFQRSTSWTTPADPNFLLLKIGGVVVNFDEEFLKWVSNLPVMYTCENLPSLPPVSDDSQVFSESLSEDINKDESASSEQRSKTGLTGSQTVAQTSSIKKEKPVSAVPEIDFKSQMVNLYNKLKSISVQVDVESVCILFPKSPWLFSVPKGSIEVKNQGILAEWKNIIKVHPETEVFAFCFPYLKLVSCASGPKVRWDNLTSLPAAELEGLTPGEKFPWSVTLSNFTVFEAMGSKTNYLLKPSSTSGTIAFTYKLLSCESSQVGLCVHLDMEPFHLCSSKDQLSKLHDSVKFLLSVYGGFKNSILWFDKPAASSLPLIAESAFASKIKSRASVTESGSIIDGALGTSLAQETSEGSITSMETAKDVRLTLWLQWTLPKFGINLFGVEKADNFAKDVWLQLEMEEVTASLDVQDIYRKGKLKLSSFNISCFEKNLGEEKWNPGPYEGIVFSSSEKITKNIEILSSKPALPHSHFHVPANQGKKQDCSTHAFLTFTCTQALCTHVQQRLQKEPKKLPCDNDDEKGSVPLDEKKSKYLCEMDIKISPFDIIFRIPLITSVMEVLKPLTDMVALLVAQETQSVGTPSGKPVTWNFNNQVLPLLYLNTGTIRLFFPKPSASVLETIKIEMHNMCVLQITSITLSPQVDNPLSRIIVSEDIYLKAQERNILNTLGSDVEDRQYQLDVIGLNLCTLTWEELAECSSTVTTTALHVCSAVMGENPAFEWNSKPAGVWNKDRVARFAPVTSQCDLRVTLAPAIICNKSVWEGGKHKDNDILVCGHSFEGSITCDIEFYLSLQQLSLLHDIVLDNLSSLSVEFMSAGSQSISTTVIEPKDSGLDSEVSTLKTKYAANSKECSQTGPDFVPFEVLLTAGTISLTLGMFENESQQVQKKHYWKYCKKYRHMHSLKIHERGLSKESLEESSSESSPVHPNMHSRRAFMSNESKEEGGYEGSEDSSGEEIDSETPFLEKEVSRNSRMFPFLHILLSQPHVFMSCTNSEQRAELSCFDVQISGVPNGFFMESSGLFMHPASSVFTVPWLETRPGEPNPKTGIPPSLFTISVRDFLKDSILLNIKLERPIKANFSFSKLDQAIYFIDSTYARIAANSPSSSSSIESVSAKCDHDDTVQSQIKTFVVNLETVPVAFMCDIPSEHGDIQLVVSLDSHYTNLSLSPSYLGSLNNFKIETKVNELQAGAYYQTKKYNFFGPSSIFASSDVFWQHKQPQALPHSVLRVKCDTLPISIGPVQLLCCNIVYDLINDCSEVINNLFSKVSQNNKPGNSSSGSLSKLRKSAEPKKSFWSDDLRKGFFQYIQDYGMPNPNEIVFCRPSTDTPGMMTWRYPEPRMLTRVDIYPVPFSASGSDFETHDSRQTSLTVDCNLQYWDSCRETFTTYQQFQLSESTHHSLDLPSVCSENEHLLVISDTWRVVLACSSSEDPKQEAVISPLALAACMRVDSLFDAHLIPLLKARIFVDMCQITFYTNNKASAVPVHLKPFTLDDSFPHYFEFLTLMVDNFGFSYTGWKHKHNFETELSLAADVVEFTNLTYLPILEPVDLQAQLVICKSSSEVLSLEADITVHPVFLKISQSVMHTLLLASSTWNNKESQLAIIPTNYIICNNTQETIRFGQAGTDESIVLKPHHMHPYCWRNHKLPSLLRLCVESQKWRWSQPFSVTDDEEQVIKIVTKSSAVTLLLQVKMHSGSQTQVIISGQIILCSHITENIEAQFQIANVPSAAGMSSQPLRRVNALINHHHCLPSFLLNPTNIHNMFLRLTGLECPWSKEIKLQNWTGNWAEIIEIPKKGHLGDSIQAWCCGTYADFKNTVQLLITFSPMYVIRNHLPCPLMVHIETAGEKFLIEVPGQGQEHHLIISQDPNLAKNLTFQLGPGMKLSSPPVQLNDPVDVVPPNISDFADLVTLSKPWTSPYAFKWPFHNEEGMRKVDDLVEESFLCYYSPPSNFTSLVPHEMPDIELQVTQTQCWNLFGTVFVDVKPWALMVNQTGQDLYLIESNGREWKISHGKVFTPPPLQDIFHLGIDVDGDLFKCSQPLKLYTGHVDSTGSESEPVLYITKDNTPVNIFVNVSDTVMMCRLNVVLTEFENCMIFSITPAVFLTNRTDNALEVCGFSVPQNAKMVHWPDKVTQTSLLKPVKNSDKVQPLLFWEVPSTVQSFFVLTSYQYYIAFSRGEKHNNKSCWSYPVRLHEETLNRRYTVSLPLECKTPFTTRPLVLTSHLRNGVTYLIISSDPCPLLKIYNRTGSTLQFGESSDTDSGDVCIVEETEAIFLPSIPPSCSVHYTPPSVSADYPNTQECSPLIRFACLPSTADTDLWSTPVTSSNTLDQFIKIPNFGDVRICKEKIGHTMNFYLYSVSRAEVSAKEIRSRIGDPSTSTPKRKRKSWDHTLTTVVDTSASVSTLKESSPCLSSIEAEVSDIPLKENTWTMLLSYFSCSVKHACFILCDDTNSGNLSEVLRLSLDNVLCVSRPKSKTPLDSMEKMPAAIQYDVFLFIGNLQLDNQLPNEGVTGFDFPVMIIPQDNKIKSKVLSFQQAREDAVVSVILSLEMYSPNDFSTLAVNKLNVKCKPLSLFIEDTVLYHLLHLKPFFGGGGLRVKFTNLDELHLPSEIVVLSRTFSHPVHMGEFCIEPVTLLISIHASIKLYLSLNQIPLTFKKFERVCLLTSSYQLGQLLTRHYLTGALLRAGWVVGSLDLLGNPAGLVQAITHGMSDLVLLPYRGLLKGPWAFFLGVSHGTSSLIKQLSSGALTSVTNLATSVSRNLDRMSLDSDHLAWKESLRRTSSSGMSGGLAQGLTSFGISVLGAIAGIVDHPIQAILCNTTESASISAPVTGLVAGVGKGLIGVVTKPIGGAAELVAQTGKGLLQGTGWGVITTQRYEAQAKSFSSLLNSHLKFRLKFLHDSAFDMLFSLEATQNLENGQSSDVILLLSQEFLCVVSKDNDAFMMTFTIGEVNCQGSSTDMSLLTLFPKALSESQSEECADGRRVRVAEYVSKTCHYANIAPHSRMAAGDLSLLPQSAALTEQFYKSYDFFVYPKLRPLFIMLFNKAKRKASGKGFYL